MFRVWSARRVGCPAECLYVYWLFSLPIIGARQKGDSKWEKPFSAKICGLLRFPAKICGFLRFSAQICDSQIP